MKSYSLFRQYLEHAGDADDLVLSYDFVPDHDKDYYSIVAKRWIFSGQGNIRVVQDRFELVRIEPYTVRHDFCQARSMIESALVIYRCGLLQ